MVQRRRQTVVALEEKEQSRAAQRAPQGRDKGNKPESIDGDISLKNRNSEIRKMRPRGRPWPQGVSGNPAGRPKGALNRLSRAVSEGISRAEEKMARPKELNREKPYECWDGLCVQQGVWYKWDPILQDYVALSGQEPPPQPPARFDPGARRTEMVWKGREIYVQHGWPFDPKTWRPLKI